MLRIQLSLHKYMPSVACRLRCCAGNGDPGLLVMETEVVKRTMWRGSQGDRGPHQASPQACVTSPGTLILSSPCRASSETFVLLSHLETVDRLAPWPCVTHFPSLATSQNSQQFAFQNHNERDSFIKKTKCPKKSFRNPAI